MVDERIKLDFVLVLDPSEQELDKKKILDVMDAYSSKGNKSAIQFLEALAKAKPLVAPPKPLSAQVVGADPAAASSEDAGTLQQKLQAGRKRRNELAEDKGKKQSAADASASKKVGLLRQLDKLQADLKATDELHIVQQVELAEADRLLGQETLRVQALELQLQESCRPSGAASAFAPPLATVEGLDARQKAEAIKNILGENNIEEVLHLLLESIQASRQQLQQQSQQGTPLVTFLNQRADTPSAEALVQQQLQLQQQQRQQQMDTSDRKRKETEDEAEERTKAERAKQEEAIKSSGLEHSAPSTPLFDEANPLGHDQSNLDVDESAAKP